jgi:hypothetical protein
MSPEVIPFGRSAQGARDDNNQLDKAGQTILDLLSKAADVAEQNSRRALGLVLAGVSQCDFHGIEDAQQHLPICRRQIARKARLHIDGHVLGYELRSDSNKAAGVLLGHLMCGRDTALVPAMWKSRT